MKKLTPNILIKTGSADSFMRRLRDVMRSADRKESIKPSYTISFEDPLEKLRFLTSKNWYV